MIIHVIKYFSYLIIFFSIVQFFLHNFVFSNKNKNSMKSRLVAFIVLSMLLFTCKKDSEIQPAKFRIDNEFKIYFSSFLKEAKVRNIIIDTTNLIITSGKQSTKDKETCGTCYIDVKKPWVQKTIEIYTDSPTCWLSRTSNGKEALIFHELGHCLLGRIDHKTDTFLDGSPKSLMHPNDTDLYSPCVYGIDDTNLCNKTERRKYYVDELFNPTTAKPVWARDL